MAFKLHERDVMRKLLQTFAISAFLLVPASAAHAQVSFGIQIGDPPPPRAYRVPPPPGPEYVWVEGYQYPQGNHYAWHNGYWTRPPYQGAYWVAPYYVGGRYYTGRWEDGRHELSHDHRWDKNKHRDWNHQPGRDDHRD
jgi:hypothetical protein